MTILIILLILLVIYFYWKSKQTPHIDAFPPKSPDVLWETPRDLLPETPKAKEIPAEQKEWFTDKRWLSDKEIDWALNQALNSLPWSATHQFKFLEATQFMFAKESLENKDAGARDSFPVLLNELIEFEGDLVFIPVNNPDFHWSLLVYENKTKHFYHFDTLRGANDEYVKPLITELLKQICQTNEPDLSQHPQTRYHLKQNNSWDCGISVIEIARQIMKDYPTYQRILLYTKLDFNFPQARMNWKEKLNHA